MDSMGIYKRRDSETGEIMTQSNILSLLIDIAKGIAVDQRLLRGSEILDGDGKIIYAIRGQESEPYIDLTGDYPEMLPHPFKEKN